MRLHGLERAKGGKAAQRFKIERKFVGTRPAEEVLKSVVVALLKSPRAKPSKAKAEAKPKGGKAGGPDGRVVVTKKGGGKR